MKPFENIVGKGENAGNHHFLHFPTIFSTRPNTDFNFSVTFILWSANAFNLDQFKKLLFGKGLRSLLKTLWGKGQNAGNHHFPLFPQCFLPYQKEKS